MRHEGCEEEGLNGPSYKYAGRTNIYIGVKGSFDKPSSIARRHMRFHSKYPINGDVDKNISRSQNGSEVE